MLYGVPPLQLQAGGTIYPCRIVVLSTVTDNTVIQATGNTAASPNIGVSAPSTRRAPGTGDDDGSAAHANENILVFGPGSLAQLELSGTSTRGDCLTSDSNGRGTTTTTATQTITAFCLQSGGANDIVQVLVNVFHY